MWGAWAGYSLSHGTVSAETRRRADPRRARSANLPGENQANFFRASGKEMFSVTFRFIIFFSN